LSLRCRSITDRSERRAIPDAPIPGPWPWGGALVRLARRHCRGLLGSLRAGHQSKNGKGGLFWSARIASSSRRGRAERFKQTRDRKHRQQPASLTGWAATPPAASQRISPT